MFGWFILASTSASRWKRANRSPSAASDSGRVAGALFTTAVVALYVVAFSLSDRRADRYIFPAHAPFALVTALAVTALPIGSRKRTAIGIVTMAVHTLPQFFRKK